jgi:zinc protease
LPVTNALRRVLHLVRILILLGAALALSCHGGHDAPEWTDPDQEIPLDPRIHEGQLANGLRYDVMRLPEVHGRVRLWLAVHAGRLEEDGDQRGLAHLVEHMAFRGTRKYPGEAIKDFVEHAGLEFGADLNADTAADQTLYKLAVPTDQPALVDRGLDVLHEWASAVTFDAAAIDLERKIVAEEARIAHDKFAISDRVGAAMSGGLRLGARTVDGENDVATAPRDALVRFYRDWYRPDLMTVIVVGDIDPDAMEAQIRARFGDLRGPASPRPRPSEQDGAPAREPIALLADPAAKRVSVRLADAPAQHSLRTVGDERAALVRSAYLRALDRRLTVLSDEVDGATAGAPEDRGLGDGYDAIARLASAPPERLAATLTALAAETARIDVHGFAADEVAIASAAAIEDERRAVIDRGVADGRAEAAALARRARDGSVVAAPEVLRAVIDAQAPLVSAGDVARSGAQPSARQVIVSAPAAADLPSVDVLRAALGAGLQQGATPLTRALPAPSQLATDPPARGRIVAERTLDGLGVTEWTLSNGAHVLVKPLAVDRGRVSITIARHGGARAIPAADFAAVRGIDRFLDGVGAGQLSHTELQKMLRDHGIQVSTSLYPDSLELAGTADRAQLDTLVQVMYLRLNVPRVDVAAVRDWRARMHRLYADVHTDTDGLDDLYRQMAEFEAGPNRWLAPLTDATIDAADPNKMLGFWWDQIHDMAHDTIVIVGDVDPSELRDLVEKYFASLAGHAFEPPARDFDDTRAHANLTVRGVGRRPHSIVLYRGWAAAAYSLAEQRDLHVLERLLQRRLEHRLREQMAGIYNVAVHLRLDLSGVRTLDVLFECDPAHADELTYAMKDEIERLRREGATADEVAILRAQIAHHNEERAQKASYWSDALVFAAMSGAAPRDVIDPDGTLRRTTVEQIKAAAAADLGFDGTATGILAPLPAK